MIIENARELAKPHKVHERQMLDISLRIIKLTPRFKPKNLPTQMTLDRTSGTNPEWKMDTTSDGLKTQRNKPRTRNTVYPIA